MYYSQNAKICWNSVQNSCILYINVLQCVSKGFAANSRGIKTGGGTNYQCLPLNPEYNKVSGKNHSTSAKLRGVEYETGGLGIFPGIAHNQNAPCARCYAKNKSSVMMIPAKRTCPDTWTKEYEGIYEWSNIYNSTL